MAIGRWVYVLWRRNEAHHRNAWVRHLWRRRLWGRRYAFHIPSQPRKRQVLRYCSIHWLLHVDRHHTCDYGVLGMQAIEHHVPLDSLLRERGFYLLFSTHAVSWQRECHAYHHDILSNILSASCVSYFTGISYGYSQAGWVRSMVRFSQYLSRLKCSLSCISSPSLSSCSDILNSRKWEKEQNK